MASSRRRALTIGGDGESAGEDSDTFPIRGEDWSDVDLEDGEWKVCSTADSKHPTWIFRGTKLDVNIWSTLDDHSLEKIIARLPFRSLFRASSLSKAWHDKFRSRVFQNEVQSSSAAAWKSYAPLFVNHKMDMVGYHSQSKRWRRLPSHSYIHQDVVKNCCLMAGGGPLLCWIQHTRTIATFGYEIQDGGVRRGLHHRREYLIHVTNPLTKTWKQLPTNPKALFPQVLHVVCEGTGAYKVIVGSLESVRVCLCLQIFDSTDDSWIEDSYSWDGKNFPWGVEGEKFEWGGSAVVNGVVRVFIYKLAWPPQYKLISWDFKDRIWKEIPLFYLNEDQKSPQFINFHLIHASQVFVCGSNIMQLINHELRSDLQMWSDEGEGRTCERLSVFRIDIERGLVLEVSRAPTEMLTGIDVNKSVAHGECIYIGGCFLGASCIVYNVRTREWQWVSSCILYNAGTREWQWVGSASDGLMSSRDLRINQWLWTSSTYQPGLNPFLKV